MNNSAWKWILAANCLIAAPVSFAAAGQHAGLRHPLAHAHHRQAKALALDPSKFQYMDSAPVYNTNHVRAAVMVFERKPVNKTNQCAALTGEARHHCYELAMPT
jgi:hypothetical protein